MAGRSHKRAATTPRSEASCIVGACMGVSQIYGYHFGRPYDKDFDIMSMLGSLFWGKFHVLSGV